MKDLWILSIQTSLPNTYSNHEDLKKTFLVFDSFEKARCITKRVAQISIQQKCHV